MEGLFRLSEEQLERIKPFFPSSAGVSRVDEPKVLSGIIQVQRHGLRSRRCPSRLWTLVKRPRNRFTKTLDLVQDGFGCSYPHKRSGLSLLVLYKVIDFAGEFSHVMERTPSNGFWVMMPNQRST